MPKIKKNGKARAARRAPSDDPVQLAGKRADFLSLPAKVRSLIEGEGLPRLRRIREAIQADAGLPMPPVRVEPWGWVLPINGDPVMFAKAFPIALGDSHCQWVAIFPASTLYIVTDDTLLRQILCHEFAHCFWYTARALTAPTDDSPCNFDENRGLPLEELVASARARDRNELIDPAAWFGEWDARNFMADISHPDFVGHPDFVRLSRVFWEKWVGAGFPVRKANLFFRLPMAAEVPEEVAPRVQVVRFRVGSHDLNFEVPEEVVRRVQEIARSTGQQPQVSPAPKPQ
jgi:hypothetical protein